MSKITKAFASKKAFIPFITCGDPDLQSTIKIVKAAVDNGADLIQLGLPFSDPTAEGQAIQDANLRALKHQVTTDDVLDLVLKMRQEISVPFILTTYANAVFSYGIEDFFKRCAQVGAEGVLLADVPYEEKDEFEGLALQHGVELISVVSPTSEHRIAKIASEAHGFIYVISSLGGNKERQELLLDIKHMVELVRANTDLPCVVGIGISNAQQACDVAAISDGAVVGSAILKIIAEHGADSPDYVGSFVKEIKDALNTL